MASEVVDSEEVDSEEEDSEEEDSEEEDSEEEDSEEEDSEEEDSEEEDSEEGDSVVASQVVHVLFCLAEVPVKTVNSILQAASRNEAYFKLFLASDPWPSSLPDVDQGTIPPVESVPRAYVGQDVEHVAKILTDLPAEKGFNRKLFAVLDETTITDGDVMLCHIFTEKVATDPEGDMPVGKVIRAEGEIEGVRVSAERSSTALGAMNVDHPDWDSFCEDMVISKWPGNA